MEDRKEINQGHASPKVTWVCLHMGGNTTQQIIVGLSHIECGRGGVMKIEWLSVPQFGDWDQKHDLPDYSLDFSKIREMRKQNKRDISRASLGNEEELISKQHHQHEPLDLHHAHHNDSPTVIALI
ncbi:hypothetical protein ACLOJK_013104 [Asimina triloba]